MKLLCKSFPVLLFVFSFVFFVSIAYGQNSKSHIDTLSLTIGDDAWYVPKEWRCMPQDNPVFAAIDFDDTSWELVNLRQNARTTPQGIAWFRLYFKADSSAIGRSLALEVKQKGASEIYLNGNLVARLGSIDTSGRAVFKTRAPFPAIFSLKDTGVNILAVRYQQYAEIT